MKTSVVLVLFLGLTAACNSSTDRKNGYSEIPKNKEDSLMQQVMAGHDAGMARMGKISTSIKKLERILDSSGIQINRSAYRQAIADLRQAETSMNLWMHEFSLDTLANESEKRAIYLENEIIKVGIVKRQIASSLQKADSLLQKQDVAH